MGVSSSPSAPFLIWAQGLGGLGLVLWALIDTPFPIFLPVLDDGDALSTSYAAAHLLGSVSALGILLGLICFYDHHQARMGWTGLLGFVLALGGTAALSGSLLTQALMVPLIGNHAPFLLLPTGPVFADEGAAMLPIWWAALFSLGFVLIGLVCLKFGMKVAAGGGLLIVGTPLFALSAWHGFVPDDVPMVGIVLFALGHAWLAYSTWSASQRPL